MAESLEPGTVVSAVAHRHDVHPNLLHVWRRQARQAAGRRDVSFLPVRVAAAKPAVVERGGGTIEIELGSGIRVRVDSRVDEAALVRVLRAVGR